MTVSPVSTRTDSTVSAATVSALITDLQAIDPARYWTVSAPEHGISHRIDDGDGFVTLTDSGAGPVGVGSLFATPGAHGVAARAVALARRLHPGRALALDCFATLAPLYASLGFAEVSRMPFDPRYAPSAWRPGYGSPDVLAMVG